MIPNANLERQKLLTLVEDSPIRLCVCVPNCGTAIVCTKVVKSLSALLGVITYSYTFARTIVRVLSVSDYDSNLGESRDFDILIVLRTQTLSNQLET